MRTEGLPWNKIVISIVCVMFVIGCMADLLLMVHLRAEQKAVLMQHEKTQQTFLSNMQSMKEQWNHAAQDVAMSGDQQERRMAQQLDQMSTDFDQFEKKILEEHQKTAAELNPNTFGALITEAAFRSQCEYALAEAHDLPNAHLKHDPSCQKVLESAAKTKMK